MNFHFLENFYLYFLLGFLFVIALLIFLTRKFFKENKILNKTLDQKKIDEERSNDELKKINNLNSELNLENKKLIDQVQEQKKETVTFINENQLLKNEAKILIAKKEDTEKKLCVVENEIKNLNSTLEKRNYEIIELETNNKKLKDICKEKDFKISSLKSDIKKMEEEFKRTIPKKELENILNEEMNLKKANENLKEFKMVQDYLTGNFTIRELAEKYGTSKSTVSRKINKYKSNFKTTKKTTSDPLLDSFDGMPAIQETLFK